MKKHLSKKHKILIAVVGALLLLFFLSPSEMNTIPDEVYAKLTPDNPYYSILKESPKKIVWFGNDNPVNSQMKRDIDIFLKENNLTNVYKQKPILQNTLIFNCKDKDCPEVYLSNNCTERFCIIFPLSHKIVRTKADDVFSTILEFKDWADYFY